MSRWIPVMSAAMILAQAPIAAAQAVELDWEYFIRSVSSDKCMNVRHNSSDPGKEIIQWQCDNVANNRWRFLPVPGWNHAFKIQSVSSGLCLNVQGGNTGDGARLIQWDCVDEPNNIWHLVEYLPGMYMIYARHSGKCANVRGASAESGAALIQWSCFEFPEMFSPWTNNVWLVTLPT